MPREFGIRRAADHVKRHDVRRLVERMLRRKKHLPHQMMPRSGKYEPYPRHILHIAAQQRLRSLFREFQYLLELVNGNDNAAVPLLQIFKGLGNGCFRLLRNDIERELGHAVLLRRNSWTATLEETSNRRHRLFRRSIKRAYDGSGKRPRKLRQVLEGEYVKIDAHILLWHLSVDMMEQSRLAISARSNERNIPIILYRRYELCRILLAITEVFWTVIADYYKRIILLHVRIISKSCKTVQLPIARFSQRTFRNCCNRQQGDAFAAILSSSLRCSPHPQRRLAGRRNFVS